MPALLVLIGCLAIVLVLALPSVARAAAATPNAAVAPMLNSEHIKKAELNWIKGNIELSPSSKTFKFWYPNCNDFVVTMSKAGGKQIDETHATPGQKPGECVYSFKAPPAGEAVLIGLREVRFKADKSDPNAVKLDKWVPVHDARGWPVKMQGVYVKMQSTDYAKLVPAVNGEFSVKLVSDKWVKLSPGQDATVPLFVNVMDSSGRSY
jgi:hypothetical protein